MERVFCYKQKGDLIVTKHGGHYLVEDAKAQIEHHLNETSYLILKACDGEKSLEDVISLIVGRYKPKAVKEDVVACIAELKKRDLIELVDKKEFVLGFQYVTVPLNDKRIAVYFPYKKVILFVSFDTLSVIKKLQTGIKNAEGIEGKIIDFFLKLGLLNTPEASESYLAYYVHNPTRLTIMPSNTCNLRCIYCYASAGVSKNQLLSWLVAKKAIDWIAKNALKAGEKTLAVSFMGGGEPTLNWEVVKKTVKYVRQKAKLLGLKSIINLTTNGVVSPVRARWIAQNIDVIKLSFDGPEEIQNYQRPLRDGKGSFIHAFNTAKIFDEYGTFYIPRATITNYSIGKLKEIVKFFLDNLKLTGKSIIINPVYVCGSCSTHNVDRLEVKEFVKRFLEIQALGREKRVDLVVPYDKIKTSPLPKLPFCGFQKGNCFLTADGYLSICSEVDNKEDQRSPLFFFGKFDDKKKEIVLNQEKMKQLYHLEVTPKRRCQTCPSSIYCSGPCLVRGIGEKIAKNIYSKHKDDPCASLKENELNLALKEVGFTEEATLQCVIAQKLMKDQFDLVFNGVKDQVSFDFQEIQIKDRGLQGKVFRAVRIS